MQTNLPEVSPGEPIKAETFNALIRRANVAPGLPELPKNAKARGEFWLKNEHTATLPACSCLRINGFLDPFATLADAFSALANDRIVFKGNLYGAGINFAYALEGIPPGKIGRCVCPQSPLVFMHIEGDAPVALGDRVCVAVAGSDSGKALPSTDGFDPFQVVAIDSTTRFAALVYAGFPSTRLAEGAGIEIDATGTGYTVGIDPDVKVIWGCFNSGTGQYEKNERYVADDSGGCHVAFGSQFERVAASGQSGFQVRIKTSARTIITSVTPTFASKEVLVPSGFTTVYTGGAGCFEGPYRKETLTYCAGVEVGTETVYLPPNG